VDPNTIEVGGGAEEEGSSERKRSAASSSNKIRLTPEEERIFRKVDGTQTVQGIIDSVGMSEFDTCRMLFDLLNRNLITTVGRGTTKQAEAVPDETVASATPGYVLAVAAILLAAVGVYATRATPFAVSGQPPLLKSAEDLLLEAVSRTRLERLDRAVLASSYMQGKEPRTLEEVVNQSLVDRSYLRDPWARPYHYALTASGYLLSGVDDAGKKVGAVIERVLPPKQP
jgi:hypothetical protein